MFNRWAASAEAILKIWADIMVGAGTCRRVASWVPQIPVPCFVNVLDNFILDFRKDIGVIVCWILFSANVSSNGDQKVVSLFVSLLRYPPRVIG